MLVLLDNTVLSNFALVGRVDLLELAVGRASTTPQVMVEFQNGVALGRVPETDCSWLSILELATEEQETFRRYLQHLNQGEAACLAVAAHRSANFLTDDRDARAFARRRGIGISGTLGILVRLVRMETLTVEEADDLLQEMVSQNYYSPVESVRELL